MLRIIQNRAAASAKSYYSQSDYLSEGQELVGFWGGKAAKQLGLSGEVDSTSFDRLCDNLHPIDNKRLTLRMRADRTVGYDFNFHAPKGVSLAYTIGQDQRILKAFRSSVEETMQEIELEAKTRIRKYGYEADRVTGNLVWATFVHTTARPVDGVPDGHLHAHCFTFNSTWDDKENAWKAGQFRDLKRDASYYEAAFHSRLAMNLRQLGYEIKRDGKSWDLAIVTPELKAKFSRRTDQIEALAQELNIKDAAAKAELGSKTRKSKAKDLSMPELRVLWNERLSDNEKELFRSLEERTKATVPVIDTLEQEQASMQWAKSHCFERDSVVAEKQLCAEALRHGVGMVGIDGIRAQLASQQVISREVDGRVLSTTPEMLAEEQAMIQNARKGRGQVEALNPNWTLTCDWLNSEQKRAVNQVLNSTDMISIIRGGAGTGKTTLMKEAVQAIEARGKKVFTFAPSSQASRDVLAKEGFNATTVAELLVSKNLQQEIAGNVVWVDEAGLLGTRTMKKVLDLAQASNARVILSGDWKQHGSVEAGAALRILEQHAGIKPILVKTIQRQSGLYKEAVALLAKGKTSEGLEVLNDLGWIKEIDDDESRYATIANDFAETMKAGQSVLAIAPTHAEGALLNHQIRSVLKTQKAIDASTERNFLQLQPSRLTTAEKSSADRIKQSDVLVYHKRSKTHRKGDRIAVSHNLPSKLSEEAECFEAFKQQSVALAQGDLLRITGNGKTIDGKHRLYNGAVYRIQGFSSEGNIRLDNGWYIDKDYGFIASGYVTTSHASQGKTVDRVLIAESAMSNGAADREQFYVSVSRGRKSATIYTDNREALREAINKSRPRISATELVGKGKHWLRVKLAYAASKRDQSHRKEARRPLDIQHG